MKFDAVNRNWVYEDGRHLECGYWSDEAKQIRTHNLFLAKGMKVFYIRKRFEVSKQQGRVALIENSCY